MRALFIVRHQDQTLQENPVVKQQWLETVYSNQSTSMKMFGTFADLDPSGVLIPVVHP